MTKRRKLSLSSAYIIRRHSFLVRNGRELGRIEGYPGEDHFWALLTMLFENAKIPLDVKG
jgi:hypothetical protein